MTLVRLPARIAHVEDLSPTAREVRLLLPEPLSFVPGAFVNVFMEAAGKKERRAYSLASSASPSRELVLSIRKGRPGGMSEKFFEEEVEGKEVTVMGPLGLNTADKIRYPTVYLFAFGIGVSVVRALAEHLVAQPEVERLVIMTGSRTEEEILYKEYFESLRGPKVDVRFVLSRPKDPEYPLRGYLQEHVSELPFSHATVYVCGQGSACEALVAAVKATGAEDTQFLIESFDA